MQQAALKGNQCHLTSAVEHNVTLPALAVKQKFHYSPYNPALAEVSKDNCALPSIHNPVNMMHILLGKRMERSSSASDLRLVVYESLEQRRANKIGVKPLRNFDVTRSKRIEAESNRFPSIDLTPSAPVLQCMQTPNEVSGSRNNSLAPFTTLAPKPTCGYFFKRETPNKKVRIGVPPSDLVKWRSDYAQFPQKQT